MFGLLITSVVEDIATIYKCKNTFCVDLLLARILFGQDFGHSPRQRGSLYLCPKYSSYLDGHIHEEDRGLGINSYMFLYYFLCCFPYCVLCGQTVVYLNRCYNSKMHLGFTYESWNFVLYFFLIKFKKKVSYSL